MAATRGCGIPEKNKGEGFAWKQSAPSFYKPPYKIAVSTVQSRWSSRCVRLLPCIMLEWYGYYEIRFVRLAHGNEWKSAKVHVFLTDSLETQVETTTRVAFLTRDHLSMLSFSEIWSVEYILSSFTNLFLYSLILPPYHTPSPICTGHSTQDESSQGCSDWIRMVSKWAIDSERWQDNSKMEFGWRCASFTMQPRFLRSRYALVP